MRIQVSQDGLVNWLVALSVGFLIQGAVIAYFIVGYMPARAEADRRMADILIFNQREWERRNIRKVQSFKNSGKPFSGTSKPNSKS